MNNLTKEGLIAIDSTTGVLKVAGLIQCDVPQIYNLEYEVIVSDLLHETSGKVNMKMFYLKSRLNMILLQLSIAVIDVNNQAPVLDAFEQQVQIYENATTGTFVGQVKAHDNDRDSKC